MSIYLSDDKSDENFTDNKVPFKAAPKSALSFLLNDAKFRNRNDVRKAFMSTACLYPKQDSPAVGVTVRLTIWHQMSLEVASSRLALFLIHRSYHSSAAHVLLWTNERNRFCTSDFLQTEHYGDWRELFVFNYPCTKPESIYSMKRHADFKNTNVTRWFIGIFKSMDLLNLSWNHRAHFCSICIR